MRICYLRIDNFRGIRHANIPISPHCAILGPNNCGKTAIAHSLALLFGRERLYQNISEHDFYGGNPDAGSRFTIVGTLTGFDSNNNDPAEYPEWFNVERGGRVAWWHDGKNTVSYEPDPPEGAELAAEIAISGRYDDDLCEFELRRYFYDGETDPFAIDPFIPFPNKLLSTIGFFLIPSLRHWDWILSFGSGQFLKLLREVGGIPGAQINAFKEEMRNPQTKIEEADQFKELLEKLEEELRSFSLLPEDSKVIYRTTHLSSRSVLESLVPHIKNPDDSILPFSRQGSGFTSIQLMLVLLQFAARRRALPENTIFLAEEPELHLQPSLQRRLINRLRAFSNQTIVTTHSHHVASMFKPSEVVYLTNNSGILQPEIIYAGNINKSDLPNQVRQLYLRERSNFYETLLGQYIIVPEGRWDWQWLRLWIRVAEATVVEDYDSTDIEPDWSLSGIEIVHTNDSSVTDFINELRRFRNDVIALVDGDKEGKKKLADISKLDSTKQPKAVIQFGTEGEIEDLAAWIMEPLLLSPGPILGGIIAQMPQPITVHSLGSELKKDVKGGVRCKGDWELHENLAWEAYNCLNCRKRVVSFLSDIARICAGSSPKLENWQVSTIQPGNIPLYIAGFINNPLS